LAVGLQIAIMIKSTTRDQLFGQRAPGSLGKDCDFGLQFIARLEVRFGPVLLVYTLVVSENTADATPIFVSIEQQL